MNSKAMRITIEEKDIALSNKQKVELARHIEHILEHITIRKRSLVGIEEKKDHSLRLDMQDYKEISVQLLGALDNILHITLPEEQLAIESSREADFGCIEPVLAAQTKLDWGRIMVAEIQQDHLHTAHRLAELLVNFLKIPLSNTIIEYLVNQHGASHDYLEKIQAKQTNSVDMAASQLRGELLTLPK